MPTFPPPSGTDQPFTPVGADELLAGIRADLRASDCQQILGDFPPGLVAVVDCAVGSDLVKSVSFAAYSNPDTLLGVYAAHLAQFDIALAEDVGPPGETPEDCWRGHPSESFYWPAGVGSQANREGCFVDGDGYANQLYVWGGPLVLISVVGATPDIAELKAWSWYDADGGEPVLGGPGLWQPSG